MTTKSSISRRDLFDGESPPRYFVVVHLMHLVFMYDGAGFVPEIRMVLPPKHEGTGIINKGVDVLAAMSFSLDTE